MHDSLHHRISRAFWNNDRDSRFHGEPLAVHAVGLSLLAPTSSSQSVDVKQPSLSLPTPRIALALFVGLIPHAVIVLAVVALLAARLACARSLASVQLCAVLLSRPTRSQQSARLKGYSSNSPVPFSAQLQVEP